MTTAQGVDAVPLARRVADVAAAVPGVVALHGGAFGEIATRLPGDRVAGVRLTDDAGWVHIVVDPAHGITQVADRVVDAASAAAGRPVSVVVEDIVTPAAADAADVSTSDGGERE